jgi:hypothetical protein
VRHANEVCIALRRIRKARNGEDFRNGRVKLYVEAVGSGTPVVFLHEYAGDYRRTADARGPDRWLAHKSA